MSQPGDNHQRALDRFLDEHPDVATELNSLNPLAAQAKGETLAQYRAERLHEAFEAQRLEVHKEVAQMAGLSWDEYCQLHDLAG